MTREAEIIMLAIFAVGIAFMVGHWRGQNVGDEKWTRLMYRAELPKDCAAAINKAIDDIREDDEARNEAYRESP